MYQRKQHQQHSSSLRSSSGSILITASVFLAVMSVITLAIPEVQKRNLKALKVARAKALMATIENKIRYAVTQPVSYNCGEDQGFSSCSLKSDVLEDILKVKIPGTVCETDEKVCMIELKNSTLGPDPEDPTVYTFSATLAFNPSGSKSEFTLKDRSIRAAIPTEILQKYKMDCAAKPSTPLFKGFDATGKIICEALPARCPAGEFASGFDPKNLKPTCQPLVTNFNGGTTSFLASMIWTQKGEFEMVSAARLNPFSIFVKGRPPVVTPKPDTACPSAHVNNNGICVPVTCQGGTYSAKSAANAQGMTAQCNFTWADASEGQVVPVSGTNGGSMTKTCTNGRWVTSGISCPSPPPHSIISNNGQHCDIGGPWGWRSWDVRCPSGTGRARPSEVGGCPAGWDNYNDIGCFATKGPGGIGRTIPGCDTSNHDDECCIFTCSDSAAPATWSCSRDSSWSGGEGGTSEPASTCSCVNNWGDYTTTNYIKTKDAYCEGGYIWNGDGQTCVRMKPEQGYCSQP